MNRLRVYGECGKVACEHNTCTYYIIMCVCVYNDNILYGNLSHTRHAEVEMVCERYSTITYTQSHIIILSTATHLRPQSILVKELVRHTRRSPSHALFYPSTAAHMILYVPNTPDCPLSVFYHSFQRIPCKLQRLLCVSFFFL